MYTALVHRWGGLVVNISRKDIFLRIIMILSGPTYLQVLCDSIRNGHADAPRVADNPQIDISGLNWTFWVWV